MNIIQHKMEAMMNLKDILAAKLKASPSKEVLDALEGLELARIEEIEEIEERYTGNDFLLSEESHSDEEALTCFLILFYKAHSKDVYISHGEGACLLYSFLGLPTSSTFYPSIPLGHSIKDHYVINNILGLDPHTVYGIMEKIKIANFRKSP